MPEGASLSWSDRGQGRQSFDRCGVGDFTLLRADGHWAYHLAVVVDDEAQEVTDVVRGADLVSATACHLALQKAMCFYEPRYMHVDVVVNEQGQKLSKQTLAEPVSIEDASGVLRMVFDHLNVQHVERDRPEIMLVQALAQWQLCAAT
jgi:glutamyl-Q tRNA(Asp) synthetase